MPLIEDEFLELFYSLPEDTRRAVAVWLALHRDFPESFPLFNFTNDPALLGLSEFIDVFIGVPGLTR